MGPMWLLITLLLILCSFFPLHNPYLCASLCSIAGKRHTCRLTNASGRRIWHASPYSADISSTFSNHSTIDCPESLPSNRGIICGLKAIMPKYIEQCGADHFCLVLCLNGIVSRTSSVVPGWSTYTQFWGTSIHARHTTISVTPQLQVDLNFINIPIKIF